MGGRYACERIACLVARERAGEREREGGRERNVPYAAPDGCPEYLSILIR